MKIRIITALVLIASVLVWLFVAPYDFFVMGALFIYMAGAWEMGPLLGYKSRIPFLVLCTAAATGLFMVAPPGEYPAYGVPDTVYYVAEAGMPLWLVTLPLLVYFPRGSAWLKNLLLTTVYGLLLLLPFLAGLLILRSTDYVADEQAGSLLILAVMMLVWAADSGALFAGMALGKTPMIPRVSPHKTMEGLAGGILLALLAMLLLVRLGWFGKWGQQLTVLLPAAFFAIVFSVAGDLAESMLKRHAGVKDSGKIFPGHGGVLDRIDSQLAAVPIFVCVCRWLGGA